MFCVGLKGFRFNSRFEDYCFSFYEFAISWLFICLLKALVVWWLVFCRVCLFGVVIWVWMLVVVLSCLVWFRLFGLGVFDWFWCFCYLVSLELTIIGVLFFVYGLMCLAFDLGWFRLFVLLVVVWFWFLDFGWWFVYWFYALGGYCFWVLVVIYLVGLLWVLVCFCYAVWFGFSFGFVLLLVGGCLNWVLLVWFATLFVWLCITLLVYELRFMMFLLLLLGVYFFGGFWVWLFGLDVLVVVILIVIWIGLSGIGVCFVVLGFCFYC